MSDSGSPPRKKSGCRATCGGSCLGAGLLILIAFLLAYTFTGNYQPHILPPKPLPAQNAYDSYQAAGRMAAANGGTKPLRLLPGRSNEYDPASSVTVIAKNRPA